MKTYYKGTLVSEIEPANIKIGNIVDIGGYRFDVNPGSINLSKLRYDDKDNIKDFIQKNYGLISYYDSGIELPQKINSIIDRILLEPDIYANYEYQQIIYEKIEDIHGNFYAKELISGLIFPIYNNEQAQTKYKLKKTNGIYIVGEYQLTMQKNYNPKSMKKCYCMIGHEEIADNNEVSSYQSMFDKGIGKRRKKEKFIASIKELFNKNVFKEEIKPKKEEIKIEKQTQSVGTTVMENIEYLLTKLSKINKDVYNEYKRQYESIIDNENFVITELASFEGKLEFYLMFNKKGIDNIIEYLESLKIEYLENNLNEYDINTSISLDDIDKIEELFLKSKNEYSLTSQRKILKDIAFIYLMEVYENIDNIPIELLRRSYFSSNLKTILIVIESLRELEIIENDLIIDLNTDITLENILDIIRRIKFIRIEKESVPTLIKKI